MLRFNDYISMIFFIVILITYVFFVLHTIFIKKVNTRAEFKIEKLGIWEFIVIALYISGVIRGFGYANNTKISIIYIACISLLIGFVVSYLVNRFSKEKINETANGINIEELKEYVYEILEKYNLHYKEVNNDSEWLKDIRIEYEKKEAKIELHRNGESITLIFIRSLNILPDHALIISDLKNIINANAKEPRFRDKLRPLVIATLIIGYFLVIIGSTFFYKIA